MSSEKLKSTYLLDSKESNFKEFLHYGKKICLNKDTALLQLDEPMENLYYLEEGEINLILHCKNGNERLLYTATAGNFIGEIAFLHDTAKIFSLVTTKNSVIYSISKETFNNELSENPKILRILLDSIVEKSILFMLQSLFFVTNDVQSLICNVLKLHIIHEENRIYSCTMLTQEELASHIGLHRVTVNNHLRILEKNGIIGKYNKKKVEILDIQAFNKISEEM